MSVKFLAIGDLHLKTKNAYETNILLSEIKLISQNTNPDFIVILGDTLDTHEKIHLDPFIRATKFLEELSFNFKVFLLIGNHDLRNNNEYLSSVHAFYPLKHKYKNLIIVDDFTLYEMKGINFFFFPYLPIGKFIPLFEEKRKELYLESKDEKIIIFAHQEFYFKGGFNINAEKWPLEYPLIISGHIHERMKVQKNLIYIGTPIQHSFGESEDKGISIFSFNSNDINNYSEEIIRFDIKIYKTIEVNGLNELEEKKEFIMKEHEKDNLYLRLIINSNQEELNLIKTNLFFRKLKNKKDIKIVIEKKEEKEKERNRDLLNKTYLHILDKEIRKDKILNNYWKKIKKEFDDKRN